MSQTAAQDERAAAKALLAFWRAAGVDMDEAESVFGLPTPAPQREAPREAQREPLPRTAKTRPAARSADKSSPISDARALAQAATTVQELKAAVESYSGCALKATARTTVFSDGLDEAEVLVIGEAPGKEEDEQGKPFVGRSGKLLDRMLGTIGLSRQSNIMISNTIYWRPPGNRDPTQGETASCMPFVERLIELKKPKLLLLVGKVAAQTVLKREDAISRMRGRRLSYQRDGLAAPVNAMVMLHPAYLLRRPQEKKLAWADLMLLETWLGELGAPRDTPPF
ncbi:uracil-DNA glycosylase, family 4 [alpha proteobacterium U9-1i]|nr:uracil-DNA glycosylase, family 4 [alpha proteobacterium U9-1i]